MPDVVVVAVDDVVQAVAEQQVIVATAEPDKIVAMVVPSYHLTAGNDVVGGTENTDAIFGEGGDDIILGRGGNDHLEGGQGNDSLEGGSGADYLIGGTGDDYLNGGKGADRLEGGAGNDTYRIADADYMVQDPFTGKMVPASDDLVIEGANAGYDRVLTNLTNITLWDNVEALFADDTMTGAVTFTGNGLANVITGAKGNDTIYGGGGDDTLNGAGGKDFMAGGSGNDTYYVDRSDDMVSELAYEGIDTVISTALTYTLGAHVENLVMSDTTSFDGISKFTGIGNALNNKITGDGNADILRGLDGDDELVGNAGNDTLEGGNGADLLNGGTGADAMAGGAGSDIYVVDNAGDTVDESAAGSGGTDMVRVYLSSYTLGANVENLTYMGSGNFTGTGNGLANLIQGGAGNDALNGDAGNDTLTGGNGNDTLNGGTGSDLMSGGAGNDRYVVDSASDIVSEAANAGTDTVSTDLAGYTLGSNLENLVFTTSANHIGGGNGLANMLTGNGGNDTLRGYDGADYLYGKGGNDALEGGEGNDALYGESGNDRLEGGAGGDTLYGGIGNDALYGQAGADVHYGGIGADRFVFTTADFGTVDEIRDFVKGEDKLDLWNLDARLDLPGDQALTFIYQQDFYAAGQVRYEFVGGDTRVSADVDGDHKADLAFTITGEVWLGVTDFVL